jgi:hypothetical protein
MDQADRDENVAIGRFQRMEKLWRDVAEAASRADAVLRMERALQQLPQAAPPMPLRRT